MDSFEEFKTFISLKSFILPVKTKKLLYLVTYPDKLEWDYGVEKQTQMTYLQMSGGGTGAGTGHYIKLCKQSEVSNLLKKETETTHVMICSVGMLFVVIEMAKGKPDTPITDFEKFSESKIYCKAHIIAKPGDVVTLVNRHLAEPWPSNPNSFTAPLAHLHHQHIELNLNMWREMGCPDVYEKFEYEERSKQNYHDDYTPLWIKPTEFPKIQNFTKRQREKKAFSYGSQSREYQNDMWKNIREDTYDFNKENENFYFNRLNLNFYSTRWTRLANLDRIKYYVENNEYLGGFPKDEEFDLIFSPCGGYTTEVLAHKLNFNGKIIIYDYIKRVLDIKQQILDMNPTLEELKVLEKMHPDMFFIWNQEYQKGRPNSFGTFKELRTWQEEMCANYDIEFWLMNLIEPDYNRLLKEVKGKRVFFNASNIFSYNKVILKYTLPEIYKSFDKLFNILETADDYHFRGTVPLKRWKR